LLLNIYLCIFASFLFFRSTFGGCVVNRMGYGQGNQHVLLLRVVVTPAFLPVIWCYITSCCAYGCALRGTFQYFFHFFLYLPHSRRAYLGIFGQQLVGQLNGFLLLPIFVVQLGQQVFGVKLYG